MNSDRENSVCIIGAGLSGLVTAKVLKHDGFDVTIFEKEPTIGGVWAPSRAYAGLRSNNPQQAYALSDFRYPETSDEFPTAGQVFEYLRSYAEHSGLEPHLNLSTEVLSVGRRTAEDDGRHPGFHVTIRTVEGSADADIQAFDFVVVCNGVFSEPYVPQIEGQERFGGSRIHSSEMASSICIDTSCRRGNDGWDSWDMPRQPTARSRRRSRPAGSRSAFWRNGRCRTL